HDGVAHRPALLELNRVVAHRFESEDVLVEVASLVQIKRRKTDMGKSFVGHFHPPPWNLPPESELSARLVTASSRRALRRYKSTSATPLLITTDPCGSVTSKSYTLRSPPSPPSHTLMSIG